MGLGGLVAFYILPLAMICMVLSLKSKIKWDEAAVLSVSIASLCALVFSLYLKRQLYKLKFYWTDWFNQQKQSWQIDAENRQNNLQKKIIELENQLLIKQELEQIPSSNPISIHEPFCSDVLIDPPQDQECISSSNQVFDQILSKIQQIHVGNFEIGNYKALSRRFLESIFSVYPDYLGAIYDCDQEEFIFISPSCRQWIGFSNESFDANFKMQNNFESWSLLMKNIPSQFSQVLDFDFYNVYREKQRSRLQAIKIQEGPFKNCVAILIIV